MTTQSGQGWNEGARGPQEPRADTWPCLGDNRWFSGRGSGKISLIRLLWSKDQNEMRNSAMWRSGGKALQFEGAANAKPMEGRLRHSKEASMQGAGARAECAGA